MLALSHINDVNVNWYNLFGAQSGNISQKLEMCLSYDPAVPRMYSAGGVFAPGKSVQGCM